MQRLLSIAAVLASVWSLPLSAQTQRPPAAIAVQAGAEECDSLSKTLGREGVWVSDYTVSGGRSTFSTSAHFGSDRACFRSIQQCERFLTELTLDFLAGDASGDCRKGL